jgi:hypothetical protein
VQVLGGDFCRATDLRGRILRHPLLATGLGACLGFAGGPFALRAIRRLMRAASKIAIHGAGAPYALPGLALASLRKVGLDPTTHASTSPSRFNHPPEGDPRCSTPSLSS